MNKRYVTTGILLSSLLAMAACGNESLPGLSDTADDSQEMLAGEEVTSMEQAVQTLAPCGIWISDTYQHADTLSTSGTAPNVQVNIWGYSTCIDALNISWNLYPNNSIVRYWGHMPYDTPNGVGTPPSDPVDIGKTPHVEIDEFRSVSPDPVKAFGEDEGSDMKPGQCVQWVTEVCESSSNPFPHTCKYCTCMIFCSVQEGRRVCDMLPPGCSGL